MTQRGDRISTSELEHALRCAAHLVDKHGDLFAPFFVRLEAELKARQSASDVRARAQALLQKEAARA